MLIRFTAEVESVRVQLWRAITLQWNKIWPNKLHICISLKKTFNFIYSLFWYVSRKLKIQLLYLHDDDAFMRYAHVNDVMRIICSYSLRRIFVSAYSYNKSSLKEYYSCSKHPTYQLFMVPEQQSVRFRVIIWPLKLKTKWARSRFACVAKQTWPPLMFMGQRSLQSQVLRIFGSGGIE